MRRVVVVLLVCAWVSATPAQAGEGWYLLAPPARFLDAAKNIVRIGTDDPLSSWSQIRSFDTATECESARTAYEREGRGAKTGTVKPDASTTIRYDKDRDGRIVKLSPEQSAYLAVVERGHSRCVAAADPRLAIRQTKSWMERIGDWWSTPKAPADNDPLGIRR